IFLLLLPFIKDRPGPDDIEPESSRPTNAAPAAAIASDTPLTPFQLLRMPQFWIISLGASISLGALQAIVVSMSPLAQDRGLTVTQSATLLSLFGASAVVAKLILAWLGDRLDRTITLAALFAMIALTSTALMFSGSLAALFASALSLGLVAGTV